MGRGQDKRGGMHRIGYVVAFAGALLNLPPLTFGEVVYIDQYVGTWRGRLLTITTL